MRSINETTIALCSVSDEAREIYARRIARQLAGWTLILFAVFLVISTSVRFSNLPVYVLLAAWPFAAFVYATARVLGNIAFRYDLSRTLAEESRRTQGEVALTALARLRARAIVEPRERSSFASLLAGVMLLGPLTLHFVVASFFSLVMVGELADPSMFTRWIKMSLVFVGHAHVVFAIAAAKHARKMSELGATSLAAGGDGGGNVPLTYAVIAASIPGVIALAIPPLLVGLTGAAMLPVFHWARRLVLEERRAIENASLPAQDDVSAETFDEIRSVAEWRRGSRDVRALAIRALAERFSRARVAPVLDRLVGSASGFVRDSAIEVSLAIHHHPELDVLLAILPLAPARTAQLIACGLVRYDDERVEPALIALLSRDEKAVRIAAAGSLARIGTREAVVPLLRIAEGLHSIELRAAARSAIDRIQARLGRTERGELSLIESDERGALSVPERDGALSITSDRTP